MLENSHTRRVRNSAQSARFLCHAVSPSQVLEAAVVAKADDRLGALCLCQLKKDAGVITEHDIIDHYRANMAHFKVLRTVIFGELPKTSTGKI